MSENCCINQANVDNILSKIPSDELLEDVSDIFKLMGDPTRIRIIAALRINELCVGDLSAIMDISQSGVSHQLRLLKKNRLVKSRREGKMIYYSVDDDHISLLLDIALNHIME